KDLTPGASWKRTQLGGRDFSMWTPIESDPKWWAEQKLNTLTLPQLFWQFSPAQDIREQFHKQFASPKEAALVSWPGLLPGVYLGSTPDLSPDTPLRRWLEQTRTPFYILTNYANPTYTEKTGPATYQALTGPLSQQFLGYIHGEAVGTPGVALPDKPLGKT